MFVQHKRMTSHFISERLVGSEGALIDCLHKVVVEGLTCANDESTNRSPGREDG